MSTILIIIVVLLLLGGGGGYYAHGRYGGTGLGGVFGLVVIVLLLLWLFGGLGGTGRIYPPAMILEIGLRIRKGLFPSLALLFGLAASPFPANATHRRRS